MRAALFAVACVVAALCGCEADSIDEITAFFASHLRRER